MPDPFFALAVARADGSPAVMAVNFQEPLDYAESRLVTIDLVGLPAGRWTLHHWRIDRDHSNAHTVWVSMGRPVVPDDAHLAALQARQGLEPMEPPRTVECRGGPVRLETTLPPHGVSLWELERADQPRTAHGE